MKLNKVPFEMIKSGKKIFELRLYDEKRKKIRIGENILFTNVESGEKLECEVTSLMIADKFNELEDLGISLESSGFEKGNNFDDLMGEYYSEEEVDRYGVVAIGIRVIE